MQSFALWCENISERSTELDTTFANVEVHFNLWTEYDGTKAPFLDVGIKVSPLDHLHCINFYVPFVIEQLELEDLGEVLSKHKEVTNAVFNENYILRDGRKEKQVQVLDEKDTPVFSIYSLDFSSNVQLIKGYDGTIIKICMDKMAVSPDHAYYFRFRVKSVALKCFINKRKERNRFFQSAFSSNYFIDFRFNDRRSLNTSLLELIDCNEQRNGKIKMDKIHFLLLTRTDVELCTNSFKSERQLEKHIWDTYLGSEPENMIEAYHWKPAVDNSVVYIKFKVQQCNYETILVYLGLLFLLTVVFNILSSIAFEWIKVLWPGCVPPINVNQSTCLFWG